jgi:hypothetical protein
VKKVGQLWMDKGNAAKALWYHEKALELDPDFCDANYTQVRRRQATEAIKEGSDLVKRFFRLKIS